MMVFLGAVCLWITVAQGAENTSVNPVDRTLWLLADITANILSEGDLPLQTDGVDPVIIEGRILGGTVATHGQFPWQVAVLNDEFRFCGGSVISSQWVLTAGHCVANSTSFVLTFGSLRPFGDMNGTVTQTTTVSVLHPKYRYAEDLTNKLKPKLFLENDIGLIKMAYPLCQWTKTIAPVKLPTRSQQSLLLVGAKATVTGWGFNTYPPMSISGELEFVELEIIANAKCAAGFYDVFVIQPAVLCTKSGQARSTYNGDSGGALVWRDSVGVNRQVGMVSFGNVNGNPVDFPSGFTRVTAFLDWIANVTRIEIEP